MILNFGRYIHVIIMKPALKTAAVETTRNVLESSDNTWLVECKEASILRLDPCLKMPLVPIT